MRAIDWNVEVVNDWLQAWDYKSLGVSFGGPIGVIDWALWLSVNAGLCELVCDGLLSKVWWESRILCMGCELWGPTGGQVWPWVGRWLVFYWGPVACIGDYLRSLWKPVDDPIWDTVLSSRVGYWFRSLCRHAGLQEPGGSWRREAMTSCSHWWQKRVGFISCPEHTLNYTEAPFIHMRHDHPPSPSQSTLRAAGNRTHVFCDSAMYRIPYGIVVKKMYWVWLPVLPPNLSDVRGRCLNIFWTSLSDVKWE